MIRAILASLLLLYTAGALAADYPRDITLSWVNPSEYEDNTPILAGELTSARIECFRNNDTVPVLERTFAVTGVGLPQAETMVGVIPSPGTYTCYGYAVVVDGTESVASNAATKKYIGKPKPLTITIE